MPAREFNQFYTVYPLAVAGKEHLEGGDKVLLPQSALEQLAFLKIKYPMMFRITNPQTNKHTHCSVMEFSAEEGIIYLPYWMMQNLLIESGNKVRIQNVNLPKASFVKLQPHRYSFTQLSNPKVVLEKCLRMYACLDLEETIKIIVEEESFYFDILEIKDESGRPANAVTIVETDVNVEFAPPKDMAKEEAKMAAQKVAAVQKTVVETDGESKDTDVSFRESDLGIVSPVGSDKGGDDGPKSDYFTQLGSKGYSLKSKKKKRKKTSKSSSSSGHKKNNKEKASAKVSVEESSSESKQPAAAVKMERVVKDDVRFRYIYEKHPKTGTLRLIRRIPKPSSSPASGASKANNKPGFVPFAGKGYSLS